jgi:hypothetical protein
VLVQQQQEHPRAGSVSVRMDEFQREITLHRPAGMLAARLRYLRLEFMRSLPLPAGLAELQRHRQQFMKLNSQHPPASSAEVGSLFIDFLAAQL